MKVIFIAAGTSSRFGEYAKKHPKGLLDINGKTIIERQILLFRKNNIEDFLIITGPYHEKFNIKNVTYVRDENYESHDVLFSLMAASEFIEGEVLTTYSDIIYEESILHQILNFKSDIGIAVDMNWEKVYLGRTEHPKSQADNVLIENGKILKIKKNITEVKNNQTMGEFVGLMKLSKMGSELFGNKFGQLVKNHKGPFHDASSLQKSYLTDMLQELIDSKIKVDPIVVKGKWCEIDTPQDLDRARKLFK